MVTGVGQTPQISGEYPDPEQISSAALQLELNAFAPFTKFHITNTDQLTQIITGSDRGSAAMTVVLNIAQQALTSLQKANADGNSAEQDAAKKALMYLIPQPDSSLPMPPGCQNSSGLDVSGYFNQPGTNLLSNNILATYFSSGFIPQSSPPNSSSNHTPGSEAAGMVVLMISTMAGEKNQMVWVPDTESQNGGSWVLTNENKVDTAGFDDSSAIKDALAYINTAINDM
ncbi:MAG: hypothetical protein P0S95_04650 [Rhabdochlamydiaceae bacterium]|nr:hypothetical protein [Candidatus Amphrikana amoebophyrae]